MEPQKTQKTQMHTAEDWANLLSKRIIGCALTGFHGLGTGFLEKLYVSIREHLESNESPVIRLRPSDSQEPRDVDAGEPASV
jgi:hypothetical protein